MKPFFLAALLFFAFSVGMLTGVIGRRHFEPKPHRDSAFHIPIEIDLDIRSSSQPGKINASTSQPLPSALPIWNP